MTEQQRFSIELEGITHVIIEIFGGDNNLSKFVLEDLQEMAAGNSGSFAVIALTDFEGEEASVKSLLPGEGLKTAEYLGEIDTGDPETLATFLARALVTAENVQHKAIGFWDHGSGVFQEHDPNEIYLERGLRGLPRHLRSRSKPARKLFFSPTRLASQPRARAMLHDDTNGGVLTNYEAHGVLKAAFNRAGMEGQKIDLIFSDTCLNGMIEVLEQFKEFAHVVVGSEDLEPGDGWEYQEWFELMSGNPPADAAVWGKQAVEAFELGYRNRPYQFPCTLGAFKTESDLTANMGLLFKGLSQHGQEGMQWVKLAILDSQSFARRDTFDIRDFMEKLKRNTAAQEITTLCDKVIAAFDAARIHTVALGDNVKDANGLAFWYPTSKYGFTDVVDTYSKLAFDKETKWSDYLKEFRFV